MKSLLLAGLLAWLPSGLFAQAADYPRRLALALSSSQALPAAPQEFQDLGREAQDLTQGRAPQTPAQAHEQRVWVFCRRLPVSDEQRQVVFARLHGLVQGQAAAWTGHGPAISAQQQKRLSGRLNDLGLALGQTAFEAGPPAGQQVAVAPADAPIPLAQLETWMDFGAKTDPAAEYARKSVMRMQQTPEGREVLRELQDEYSRAGKKVTIEAKDFEGSEIVRGRGMEGILGIRGQASYGSGTYRFNHKFLDFKDQQVAGEMLAGNMAHELRHLALHAKIARLAPGFEGVFGWSMANEQSARLTGYLVAGRLNAGRPTDYTEEARDFAMDPDAFWEDLRAGSSYADEIFLEELKHPQQAFSERLTAVEVKIKMYEQLRSALPSQGAQLAIMEEKEGLKSELSELRSQYEGRVHNYPESIKEYEELRDSLKELLDSFKGKNGKKKVEKFQAAAKEPAFVELSQRLQRDQAALAALVVERRFSEPGPVHGQMSWAEFHRRVAASQSQHPEYWTDYRKQFGKS